MKILTWLLVFEEERAAKYNVKARVSWCVRLDVMIKTDTVDALADITTDDVYAVLQNERMGIQ